MCTSLPCHKKETKVTQARLEWEGEVRCRTRHNLHGQQSLVGVFLDTGAKYTKSGLTRNSLRVHIMRALLDKRSEGTSTCMESSDSGGGVFGTKGRAHFGTTRNSLCVHIMRALLDKRSEGTSTCMESSDSGGGVYGATGRTHFGRGGCYLFALLPNNQSAMVRFF